MTSQDLSGQGFKESSVSEEKESAGPVKLERLENLVDEQGAKAIIIPDAIKITPKAKEKAMVLGPEVARIGKGAFEWYGFLLGYTGDKDHIVRDLILAPDQDAGEAFVVVDGANVAKVAGLVKELNTKKNKDYQIVGWVHNHGRFHTCHSDTDDRNFLVVLNSVSLNTEGSTHASFPLIESGLEQQVLEDRILVKGSEITDGAIEYLLKDDAAAMEFLNKYGINPNGNDPKKVALLVLNDLLKASSVDVKEPKIIGFSYSIVVNNKGDEPYSEIAVLEENGFTRQKKAYVKKEVPISVVEVADDIEVNKEDLEKEIKEKIKFPVKPVTKIITTVTGWKKGDRKSWKEERERRRHWDNKNKRMIEGWAEAEGDEEAEEKKRKKALSSMSLQQITELFAKEVIEDALGLGSDYGSTYGSLLDHVCAKMFTSDCGLIEAVRSFKPGKYKDDAENGAFDKAVSNQLAERIYNELRSKEVRKDEKRKLMEFMVSFALESGGHERDEEVAKYLPRLLNVDPALREFADKAVEYASEYGNILHYNLWMRNVVKGLIERDDCDLEGAIASAGKISVNFWSDYSQTISTGEENYFRMKIYFGNHSPETMSFMKGFNDKHERRDAIKKYASSVLKKAAKEEDAEVEEILRKKGKEGNEGKGGRKGKEGEESKKEDYKRGEKRNG